MNHVWAGSSTSVTSYTPGSTYVSSSTVPYTHLRFMRNSGTGQPYYVVGPSSASQGVDNFIDGVLNVKPGEAATIKLPDGSFIEVLPDGSYSIIDKDAKVTYRANRVRDFNSFINASDKVEAFIRFCGEQGVRQGEMLDLPIHLFIKWLIIEAARADNEPEPDVPLLTDLRKAALPRCRCCGRFISPKKTQKGMFFCSGVCYDRYNEKGNV